MAARLTYDTIRRQLPMANLRRAITRGNGGKLAFLWVLGAGALLTLAANPLLAAVYTVACAVLAIPVTRDELQDPNARRLLTEQLIAEHLPNAGIGDADLQGELARTRRTLAEMADRIAVSESRGKEDPDLGKVFSDASELASLQLESARQAEDLERIIDFVVGNVAARGASSGWEARDPASADAARRARREQGTSQVLGRDPRDDADRLRHDNMRAVVEEAQAAREMVTTIGGRIETMLLQAFRLERDAADRVRTSSAAAESHETVVRLQDVIEARRRAAERLGELLSDPDAARDRG